MLVNLRCHIRPLPCFPSYPTTEWQQLQIINLDVSAAQAFSRRCSNSLSPPHFTNL
jgi:hypothetical protein